MRRVNEYVKKARTLGFSRARIIDPVSIAVAEWVRWKCQFGCDGFNTSLMCPPHTPTPEQTRALLAAYRRAILFEARRGRVKATAVALERALFLAGHYKALGLARRCSSGP